VSNAGARPLVKLVLALALAGTHWAVHSALCAMLGADPAERERNSTAVLGLLLLAGRPDEPAQASRGTQPSA